MIRSRTLVAVAVASTSGPVGGEKVWMRGFQGIVRETGMPSEEERLVRDCWRWEVGGSYELRSRMRTLRGLEGFSGRVKG